MSDLFSGLESLGLGSLEGMSIYDEEKKAATDAKGQAAVHEVTEEELLLDRTFKCPVCDNQFKSKTVKTGKVRLLSQDTDLRPKYTPFDALKYDAVACPKCGSAAVARFFNVMTTPQAKLIKEKISVGFKGIDNEKATYSYEDAIERHKLALVNAVVKKARISERAYTCMRLGWLYRGMAEALPKDTPNYETTIQSLKAQENEFIKNAYEGFSAALSKEDFPICGMDENTLVYLVADLARRSGKYDIALKLLSEVITSRSAKSALKDKARDLKEIISAERK